MMYKLRFQKAGPYAWGEIHVVVGEIGAIHSLYNALLAMTKVDRGHWTNKVVAEVSAVGASGDAGVIFQTGVFKRRGESFVDESSGKE